MATSSRKPGILTISIDVEHAWGVCDKELTEQNKLLISNESQIIKRLLEIFDQFEAPATWAITAHLVEAAPCSAHSSVFHPEYPRPVSGGKGDWFFQHPRSLNEQAWYCPNVVNWISESKQEHEIGSHSYAHIIYDEATTEERAVEADIANLRRVHAEMKSQPTSFIFPRNKEGYHAKLEHAGFSAYRGFTGRWYDKVFPKQLARILNLISYFLGITPKTVRAHEGRGKLVNIPDSMLFLGRNGLRALIPPSSLYRMATKGISKAAKRGEIFHLWFHPSNFSYETETQFELFSRILEYAAKLRDEGNIEIVTMRKIARNFREAHL